MSLLIPATAPITPAVGRTCQMLDERKVRQRLRKAKKQVEKVERRLQRALDDGDHRTARKVSRDLCTSYDAKLLSIGESVSRYRCRTGIWVPYTDFQELARTVNAVQAPKDVILVRAAPKAKRAGFRVISEYGLVDSARQRLVQRAITPLLKTSEVQFGRRGFGRNDALRRVADCIRQEQHEWVVVCDLKSFFSSVNREWLKTNLPIEERVIASVILAEDDRTFRPLGYDHPSINIDMVELETAGRSGLPQGARTSSVVGTHVVASVLEGLQLPACVEITVYVDDFVITAPTRSEVVRAFDALRDEFARHPAGTFSFSETEPTKISDGFVYLGYSVESLNGDVHITIPEGTCNAFLEKMFGYLDELDSGGGNSEEFRRWFCAWWRAYAAADSSLGDQVVSDLELEINTVDWCSPDVEWAFRKIYEFQSVRQNLS